MIESGVVATNSRITHASRVSQKREATGSAVYRTSSLVNWLRA